MKEAVYMDNSKVTKSFQPMQRQMVISEILKEVYTALETKGYDPVSQLVGYIMSGDPTYITSYGNARTMISMVERDEILEELVKNFIKDVKAAK